MALFVPLNSQPTFAAEKKYSFEQLKKDPQLITEISKKYKEEYDKKTEQFKKSDRDQDGLTDFFEFNAGLDINKKDSNGNKVSDSTEDLDGDGLTNLQEQQLNTNPTSSDTDRDGLTDAQEVHNYGTNPSARDTDKDGISDFIELKYTKTHPKKADSNGDGVKDGTAVWDYKIPKNTFGISGTVKGKGDIPYNFAIRKSPILLVQKLDTVKTFDIGSTDSSLTFMVSIPVPSGTKHELKLFRYEYQGKKFNGKREVTLKMVEKQHYDSKTQTIQAEFKGGDSFVVLAMDQYRQALIPNRDLSEGFKKFNGKAQIVGIPGIKIDSSQVNKDGIFKIKKKVNTTDQKQAKEQEASYKIKRMKITGDTVYVTAVAVTVESGHTPTVMVHGLTGNSTTWGVQDKWTNTQPLFKQAQDFVNSNETYSGYAYDAGTFMPYYDPNTHFIINGYSEGAEDPTGARGDEMGVHLIKAGYTPNVDLFQFEYYNIGRVFVASYELYGYLKILREWQVIPSTQPVNLLAHSMGGLVSRYYIENVMYQSNPLVQNLITLGTPHFGSDTATELDWPEDLDRFDSCLWNSGQDCTPLTNVHSYTNYYAFGGFLVDAATLEITGLRGVHPVDKIENISTATSYHEDVDNRFKAKDPAHALVWDEMYPEIEDGGLTVNIDSALGSDKDPEYNTLFFTPLPTLDMTQRWYIFHESYGGHSEMRRYWIVQDLVYRVLNGLPYYTG